MTAETEQLFPACKKTCERSRIMPASLKDTQLLKLWMQSTIFEGIQLVSFFLSFDHTNCLQTTDFKAADPSVALKSPTDDSDGGSALSDALMIDTDDG